MIERINGSLFFSLLVFCATWLFSLFYFKTKIFDGVLIFIFFNKILNWDYGIHMIIVSKNLVLWIFGLCNV